MTHSARTARTRTVRHEFLHTRLRSRLLKFVYAPLPPLSSVVVAVLFVTSMSAWSRPSSSSYGGAGRPDGIDLLPADGCGGGSFGVACAFVHDAGWYWSCAFGRGFVVSFLYICKRFEGWDPIGFVLMFCGFGRVWLE